MPFAESDRRQVIRAFQGDIMLVACNRKLQEQIGKTSISTSFPMARRIFIKAAPDDAIYARMRWCEEIVKRHAIEAISRLALH